MAREQRVKWRLAVEPVTPPISPPTTPRMPSVMHLDADGTSDGDYADEFAHEDEVGHISGRRRCKALAVSMTFMALMVVIVYAGAKVSGQRRADDAAATQEPQPLNQPILQPRLYQTESKEINMEPKAAQAKTSQTGSMTIADFLTTRRLGEVAAPAFNVNCPLFQPKCNTGKNFASLMTKQLNNLGKHDPELAEQLRSEEMTLPQQMMLVDLLSMSHNETILRIGFEIASTVKKYAKSGEKTVHEKVQQKLQSFSAQHGAFGVPPVNNSKSHDDADVSSWSVLMHPNMLSMVGGDDDDDSKQVSDTRRLDPIRVFQGVWGVDIALRLVLLVFEILNKVKKVIMPVWMKTVIMWGNVIGGAITCVVTVLLLCPIVFLQYWLNAWLLFSNNLDQMAANHIPFWKIMQKLPGLNMSQTTTFPMGGRRLLAVDSRFAA